MSSTASAGNSREVAETQGNKEPAKSPPLSKSAKCGKVRQKLQPPRNQKAGGE